MFHTGFKMCRVFMKAIVHRSVLFLWVGEVSPYAAISPFVESFCGTALQMGKYAATPSYLLQAMISMILTCKIQGVYDDVLSRICV